MIPKDIIERAIDSVKMNIEDSCKVADLVLELVEIDSTIQMVLKLKSISPVILKNSKISGVIKV